MVKYQKTTNSFQKKLRFFDEQGQEIKYFFEHDDEGINSNDLYPIFCRTSTGKRRLQLKIDGHEFEVTEPITTQISSLNAIFTNFKLGQNVNVPRTKIEIESAADVTAICEIVNPNKEYLSYYRFLVCM